MPTFAVDPTFDPKLGITIRMAPDATGMKHGNRGEWLRVKWNVKRDFFKLHILVDIDTRHILAFSITDMNGSDASQLPVLLEKALKQYVGIGVPMPVSITDVVLDAVSMARGGERPDKHQRLLDSWMYDDKKTNEESDEQEEASVQEESVEQEESIEQEEIDNATMEEIRQLLEMNGIDIELRADGGYDKFTVFALLKKLNIQSIIKIRKNANAKAGGGSRARGLAVLEQFGGKGGCTNWELNHMTDDQRMANQKDWKKDVRYGLRWIVENVISAFKRVFGESVNARTLYTAMVEIATKIAAYNYNLDIGRETIDAIRDHDCHGCADNLVGIQDVLLETAT